MDFGDRPPGCPPNIDALDWNGPANTWPSDKPFPFTPDECYWVMKGYAVLPASGPLDVETWERLIYRRWELVNGRLAPS